MRLSRPNSLPRACDHSPRNRITDDLLNKQPGAYVGNNGAPVVIKNVICIHEEDSGVLWKHTDYRPGGRTHTVRRRRLVVSMVCTLANYGKFSTQVHLHDEAKLWLQNTFGITTSTKTAA